MEEALMRALACQENMAAEQRQDILIQTSEDEEDEDGVIAMQNFMVNKRNICAMKSSKRHNNTHPSLLRCPISLSLRSFSLS